MLQFLEQLFTSIESVQGPAWEGQREGHFSVFFFEALLGFLEVLLSFLGLSWSYLGPDLGLSWASHELS